MKLIHNYLKKRYQRVKINNFYGVLNFIKYGAPRGFIPCPVIFNIFLYDLFLIGKDKDIASTADDSAPYCTSSVPDAAKGNERCGSNGIKLNTDNSDFLLRLAINSKMTMKNFFHVKFRPSKTYSCQSPQTVTCCIAYVFSKSMFVVIGNSQKFYFISAFYMFIFNYTCDVAIMY